MKMKNSMKNLNAAVLILAFWGGSALACDQQEPSAPLKTVKLSDGREILANAEGLTAYVFDNDTGSTSNCYDACATAWPPILAPEGVTLPDDYGVTVRKDGAKQLTYDGKPVYLYKRDKKEGDILGDGLGNVWHIILEDYDDDDGGKGLK